MGGALGGTAAVLLGRGLWATTPVSAGAVPTHTVWVRRPEDLRLLRVEAFGLELNPAGTRLMRTAPEAHIVVHFPPQHLHEQTYQQTGGSVATPVVPTPVRLAGESRLAFLVPDGIQAIDYTPEALLDWSRFELALVPAAVRPGAEPSQTNLVFPTPTHTALEMPWHLLISPVTGATFSHPSTPVTGGDRTELWRTRMAGSSALRAITILDDGSHGVASGGLNPIDLATTEPTGDHPFDASLSPVVRAEIMLATSDYGARDFSPAPVIADRLSLSTLGADLRAAGNWNPYERSALERWSHQMTMGRDLNVEVVRAGWLFPTGHRVSLVSITERTPMAVTGNGTPLAPLVKRDFLVIGDPVRRLGGAEIPNRFHPNTGRRFPFTEIRLLSDGTADLDAADPKSPSPYQPPGTSPDVIRALTVNGQPFLFDAVGTDWAGRDVPFRFPGWFVVDTAAFDASKSSVRALVDFQQGLAIDDPMRQAAIGGATIALAPSAADGDTDAEVHRIVLGADLASEEPPVLRAAGQPVFFPGADLLMVRLRGSDVATGSNADPELVPFGYDADYVADGFEPDGSTLRNPAHVFCINRSLDVAAAPPRTVDLGGDRSVLATTADLDTAALSRTMGEIVGHLEQMAENIETAVKQIFDPRTYLKAHLAKILGRFSIVDLVEQAAHVAGISTPEALTITSREERDEFGLPERLITDLDWRPQLIPFPFEGAHIFVPDPDASLVVQGHFETDLRNPGVSSNQVDGMLRNVTLTLFFDRGAVHLLDIPIRRVEFHHHTGSKATADVDVGQIEFHGVLRYIGELADFLTRDGNGPWVEVASNGVTAGIETELPAIEVGLFAISNLTLWNQLDLPFDDRPVRFQMGVSRRDDPALLTVSMFGGGFYFQTRVSGDRLEELETSIMFGASATLDLGIASGAAGMFGGIILRLGYDDETDQDVAYMEGFFQAFGYVNVLMLVIMSCELYLGLGYDFESNKAYGRASISFSVSVLLFSFSVSVEVERRFGGEGDPTFEQLMNQNDWDAYCAAFA